MSKKHDQVRTLRSQLLTKMLLTLFVIVLIAGAVQMYFINQQVKNNVINQGELIGQSIEQGIKETDTAAKAIEHQIDLRMSSYAKHIGDLLDNRSLDEISNAELVEIKDKLGIDGITLLKGTEDDVVAVKSSDPVEIGFSFKEYVGLHALEVMNAILDGKEPPSIGGAYTEQNMTVTPIAQSGSHEDEPVFFKYAYYHPPGTDYIIDPYIEANEIYQFTQKVGPDALISEVTQDHPFVREVAVLNPVVFKDPSLEEKIYPPVKKVEYGSFNYQTEKDVRILTNLVDEPSKVQFVQRIDGEKLFKIFLPVNESQVIYIALDYGKMSGPLYRHSWILIISGVISLVALFLLTARFFNRIYENIRRIKSQISSLESRDITAKSDVNDGSELEQLSKSANRMVESLHEVLTHTNAQATKVQQSSILLEADASQSVEKMFEISTQSTAEARESLYDVLQFMDDLENYLKVQPDNEQNKELLEKVDIFREVAKRGAAATTDITLTLADLLKSLHNQSSHLSQISNDLLENISKFKL